MRLDFHVLNKRHILHAASISLRCGQHFGIRKKIGQRLINGVHVGEGELLGGHVGQVKVVQDLIVIRVVRLFGVEHNTVTVEGHNLYFRQTAP